MVGDAVLGKRGGELRAHPERGVRPRAVRGQRQRAAVLERAAEQLDAA